MADFHHYDHGSVHLIQPRSEAADQWISDNIPDDALWFAGGVVVDPRYVCNIIEGIHRDGLSIH